MPSSTRTRRPVALNLSEELRRVAGVAHRARRHGVDALGAELPGERRHAVEAFQGGGSMCRERAGGGDPAPARRRLHFVHDLDRAFRRDVGDDLADGVGADVDGGDPAMPRGDRAP